MIDLGIILIVLGLLLPSLVPTFAFAHVVLVLGIILLVVGLLLAVMGRMGHAAAHRREAATNSGSAQTNWIRPHRHRKHLSSPPRRNRRTVNHLQLNSAAQPFVASSHRGSGLACRLGACRWLAPAGAVGPVLRFRLTLG